MIHKLERITLLIALYYTPEGNVESFVGNFRNFWDKRLLYDRILLLCDLNISLTTSTDASVLQNLFMEHFSLVQHVDGQINEKAGLLYQVISSKNLCNEVTTNSFLTTLDHSVICFLLNILFVTKPTHQIVKKIEKSLSLIFILKLF